MINCHKNSWVLLLILVCTPRLSLAETLISTQTISTNTEWGISGSPYKVSGTFTIPKGLSLRVMPGVNINMSSGRFKVFGSMYMKGSTASNINLNQDTGSTGLISQGGNVEIDNVNIVGGSKVLDAYSGSTVSITNTHIDGMSLYNSNVAISVWGNSSLIFSDSSMDNIRAPYGIEVFNNSSLDINNSSFLHVGKNAALVIYGSSQGDIKNSKFNFGVVGGQFFNDANIKVTDSEFKNNSQSGFLIHNGASIDIKDSTISGNVYGIEAYSATTNIFNSAIENNTEYEAFISGGTFSAPNNWWGDLSGPLSMEANPQGKGNEIYGSSNILPWLNAKPKRELPCCSNVLFIPGLQGSRLYKKQLLSENQLWEPNRNTDVKKLFMNQAGVPLDSSSYTRDIILRTNIGFGFLDRDIYKPFADSLDVRVKKHTMNAWQAFPYDWRKSPDDIVKSGTKTSSGFVTPKDMIAVLAKSSQNKKVTIVAHSYGGLVAKALAEQLQKEGKAGLIERIILVGVPEDGSMGAVSGLLHGDDQELGRGFVLSSNVARELGLNMPSAYYLLPDQSLLTWLSTPAIKTDTNNVSDLSSLDYFLKGNQRQYSKKSSDLKLPAKLNSSLLDKARAAQSSIQISKNSLESEIPFVNIIGTGLKTVKSISYKDNKCSEMTLAIAFLGSVVCGLNHQLEFTDSGDGIVLTGNLDDRWGEKIIFDMASYNSFAHTNYSHTDMVSSKPIMDTVTSILDGGNINPSSEYIKFNTEENLPGIKRPGYKFLTQGDVMLSAISDEGRVTGLKEEGVSGYAFPIFSEIPNSAYIKIDNGSYLLTDTAPRKVIVQAGGGVGMFSIEAQKIGIVGGGGFVFEDIPVTPESHIEVDNIALSEPIMHIDIDGDGVFEKTIIYTPNKTVSSTTPTEALEKLRTLIASSTVSLRFKQRYTTRTNPLASYIKANNNSSALMYSSQTVSSLAAIVKELSRAKDRYYKGGMSKVEASYMYFSWADFVSAIKEVVGKPV